MRPELSDTLGGVHELVYMGLILGLLVVPKALQRFSIPSAITSFTFGAIAGAALGWFQHDSTVSLLAVLGIVSLFLFAGLEVDKDELRRDGRVLLQHLAIRMVSLAVATVAAMLAFSMAWRPASLVALAVLTPSTGFILSSIESMDLSDEQKRWIKSKAIASELLALGVLFVVLQSVSVERFAVATVALAVVIIVLPIAFRIFAAAVAPHAPGSEVSFLIIIAVVCAYVTKQLGVYYLVGAFVVGVAAQRFREELPAFASEKALAAVQVMASFFIPFYFFGAFMAGPGRASSSSARGATPVRSRPWRTGSPGSRVAEHDQTFLQERAALVGCSPRAH